MVFNLYKNGYFLHLILGALLYEYSRDFGMVIAIVVTTVFAVGKEIVDFIRKKNDLKECFRDFMSSEAGVVLAISAEWIKCLMI